MNKAAKFLLVSICSGMILAGCNQPAQPLNNQKPADSMSGKEVVNDAMMKVDKSGDSMEAANKAMMGTEDSAKMMEGVKTDSKAMMKSSESSGAAMEAANKAMMEAGAADPNKMVVVPGKY